MLYRERVLFTTHHSSISMKNSWDKNRLDLYALMHIHSGVLRSGEQSNG